MLKIVGKTDIDFQGKRRLALGISGIVIFIALVSLVLHGGPNYSIDFEGGLSVILRFSHLDETDPMTEGMLRASLAKVDLGSSEVKLSRSAEGEDLIVRIKEEVRFKPPEALIRAKLDERFSAEQWKIVPDDQFHPDGLPDLSGVSYVAIETDISRQDLQDVLQETSVINPKLVEHQTIDGRKVWLLTGEGNDSISRIKKILVADYPNHPFEIRSIDSVGPRMGSELRLQAVWAILAALGLIIVYLSWRFEFLFGIAAVIALFHDVMITLGVFSLLNIEISLTIIGAFLTLVGYSLNDTIVVFDRIRENLGRYRDKSYAEIINISINQNLSRTLITSSTTMLVVLVLFLMGGEVLHGFSLALLVGIIVGTYSSIYIASPILVMWAERTGHTAGKKQTDRKPITKKRNRR